MPENTLESFKKIISKCKDIFLKKNKDYGSSWTIMRPESLTDQIFIKAKRIRNLQTTGENAVGDSELDEFYSIINYCIMDMILLENKLEFEKKYSVDELVKFYDKYVDETMDLLKKKNQDYGEVWRDMRVSSMTDLVLSKLLRIKQIEDNSGKTVASEGIFSNIQDILNYSVFCIILLEENS